MFYCECKKCIITDLRQTKDWYKLNKCNYLWHISGDINDENYFGMVYYRLNDGILVFLNRGLYNGDISKYSFNYDDNTFKFVNLVTKIHLTKEEYNINNMFGILKKIADNLIFI